MSQREGALHSRDGGHQPHRVNLSRDLEQGGRVCRVFLFVYFADNGTPSLGLFLTENAGSDVSTWVHLLKTAAEYQGGLH